MAPRPGCYRPLLLARLSTCRHFLLCGVACEHIFLAKHRKIEIKIKTYWSLMSPILPARLTTTIHSTLVRTLFLPMMIGHISLLVSRSYTFSLLFVFVPSSQSIMALDIFKSTVTVPCSNFLNSVVAVVELFWTTPTGSPHPTPSPPTYLWNAVNPSILSAR